MPAWNVGDWNPTSLLPSHWERQAQGSFGLRWPGIHGTGTNMGRRQTWPASRNTTMKIITFSDLHLEHGGKFSPPNETEADLMVLAGDIINFKDYSPIEPILSQWSKPILFVAGNHEYYTRRSMQDDADRFSDWLKSNHPHVTFLRDEAISIDGVHFFGGTMWTDFDGASTGAMWEAKHVMNDFRLILTERGSILTPQDTIEFHSQFVNKLMAWLEADLKGSRVVITHHVPVINPLTKHGNSPLQPAFNSLDMIPVIEKFQPDLWICGHTHECDDQLVGKTRILSNQLGYLLIGGAYECQDFDSAGKPVVLP